MELRLVSGVGCDGDDGSMGAAGSGRAAAADALSIHAEMTCFLRIMKSGCWMKRCGHATGLRVGSEVQPWWTRAAAHSAASRRRHLAEIARATGNHTASSRADFFWSWLRSPARQGNVASPAPTQSRIRIRCQPRIHSSKSGPTRQAGSLRTTRRPLRPADRSDRRRKRHHPGCQCAGRGQRIGRSLTGGRSRDRAVWCGSGKLSGRRR